jgi:hypothetical protein
MSAIVAGTDPVLISTVIWRSRSGNTTERVWEGTADGVNGVIANLSRYDEFTIDPNNAPLYRLTVRTPDTLDQASDPQWSWEIVGEDNQKDIYEHPRIVAITQSDDGLEELRVCKDAIENPLPNASPAITDPDILRVYFLKLHGTEGWRWPTYRLRLTKTVGPEYDGEIADDGACRVYSAADIVAEHSQFPMYTRTYRRVAALQNANPEIIFGGNAALADGYTWGWLKSPTTESEMGQFRIRLQTEWVLDFWETDLIYKVK